MERDERIGWWISGIAHGCVILWAILGGMLFRPQPSHTVRTTDVATMSGAEFEAYAAAARGAGPGGREATAAPAMPTPAEDDDGAAAPAEAVPPVAEAEAQPLPAPADAEAEPDLSDFTEPEPVDVASELPAPTDQPQVEEMPDAPAF